MGIQDLLRHLLLAAEESICPHCHSSVLTIRHLLTDCLGLRHMYRHYFHSSSPNLIDLLCENPHVELINFLRYKFLSWHLVSHFFSYYFALSLLLFFLFITFPRSFSYTVFVFNFLTFLMFNALLSGTVCPFWTLCHKKATNQPTTKILIAYMKEPPWPNLLQMLLSHLIWMREI